MNPEKNSGRLTRWLLIATIALLALVLCLQLWQMFGRKSDNSTPALDSSGGPAAPQAAEPLNPPAAAVSHGKAAMIEDVQSLNPALSFDDLAALSAQELEQLWETGAPGLPIGISAAVEAAETYAGTLETDSVTSKTDPELDEAPAHYEVELRHPTLGDFEYKIDAYTGEVLEGLPDIMRSVQAAAPQETPEAPAPAQTPPAQKPAAGNQAPVAQQPAQAPASGTPPQQPADAGEEAAKNAAFAHAGVSAADASVTKCKLDWEDGRQVYEIEFWVDGIEYDYEIDASTSAVLKSGQEWDGHHAALQQPGAFIGEEAAKSAALTHAGVSAADAGYIQCELDEDDGLWVYELEFWAGNVEYEYEIDAASGAVVKAEQDR
nr:PepSY domain-containing protein [uncultured Oscillibacter sp.]